MQEPPLCDWGDGAAGPPKPGTIQAGGPGSKR